MSPQSDPQATIKAFLDAIAQRKLDECAWLLAELQNFARETPSYNPWCQYLEGILLNERDHDWARAEAIFTELLQGQLATALQSRVLMALGATYEYQGRWQEALQIHEQSLALFTTLQQPSDQAKALKNIANVYLRSFVRGESGNEVLHQAISRCQTALALFHSDDNLPDDLTHLIGSIWNTLGFIYNCLSHWEEATRCFQKDLAICQMLDDQYGIGLVYGNLGEVYQNQGRASWPQALAAYLQALEIISEFGDDYEKIEVLANLGFFHQETGDFVAALHYYAQAIALIEQLRSQISSVDARIGFAATTAGIYANTILLCLATDHPVEAFNYTERARARAYLDLLAASATLEEVDPPLALEPLTLAAAQALLPADGVLLAYFTTGLEVARLGRAARRQNIQRHRFPPARTLLFAITPDQFYAYDVQLSPNDLQPDATGQVIERYLLQPAVRKILYHKLITPVADLLNQKTRLYVVPHGPYHYVPFPALLADDGDTLLRTAGPLLIYGPSTTILLRPPPQLSHPAQHTCLAIGYNGVGALQLRFAASEAQRVAQLYDGVAWVNPVLDRTAFYAQARHYRLLHFSCHGEFKAAQPWASALYIGREQLLTAAEILQNLRLTCHLVTLSACESGLSQVRQGDEVIGLIRAFFAAGAANVLATLWRVNELSTLLLMDEFYQKVRQGIEVATALAQAQHFLRTLTRQQGLERLAQLALPNLPDASQLFGSAAPDQPFADPYYWAPFVLFSATAGAPISSAMGQG